MEFHRFGTNGLTCWILSFQRNLEIWVKFRLGVLTNFVLILKAGLPTLEKQIWGIQNHSGIFGILGEFCSKLAFQRENQPFYYIIKQMMSILA